LVLRADARRRWRAWLVLAVITGVALGGLCGAVSGARRTATAFARYTNWARSADVTVVVEGREASEQVARTPGVAAVSRGAEVSESVFPVFDGRLSVLPSDASIVVVDDRYGVDIERPRVVEGRRPVPGALEAWVNPAFAEQVGVDVGDRIELITVPHDVAGRFAEFADLAAAFAADPTLGRSTTVTIVGRGLRAADLIRDTASTPAYLVLDQRSVATLLGTPLAELEGLYDGGHQIAVRFERNADGDAAAARVRELVPEEVQLADIHDDVDDATRPYVIALVAFATLAGLVAVVVIGSAFARQSTADSTDDPVLAVLGADRRVLGVVAATRSAVIAGAGLLVTAGVATAVSPLFPLGPVRDAEPHPGVVVDLTVLVPAGLIAMTAAIVLGVWASRPRARRPGLAFSGAFTRRLAHALPVTAGLGLQLTFPTSGRVRVLMRSTMTALAVAIFGGFTVAIFASSMDDLFEEPGRHGWNWDLAVTCRVGYCDFPLTFAGALRTIDGIDAWSFLTFTTLELDGQTVPVVSDGFGRGGLRALAVSTGRLPATTEEVALGATTMRELDVNVGDEITVGVDGHRLRVVGRAVFSGLGPADTARPSLGEGAALTAAGLLAVTDDPTARDARHAYLPDVAVAAVDGPVDAVARTLRDQFPQFTVLDVQRPAGLAAWPDLRRFPTLLGLLLAILALATLTHGLAMSNRTIRHDLAILHALGLPGRGLARAVIAQALTIVGTAFVVGAPLGVIAGVAAWRTLTERVGVVSAAALRPVPALIATAVTFAPISILTVLAARTARRAPHIDALRHE
jgi:predicted lysophospholipase L1 biosynthesis ABC-type transport system permease subunit